MFIHEGWTVYRLSLDLRDLAGRLGRRSPRGTGNELAHLRRGAASIVLNIAEGSLCSDVGRKMQFYRIALASCAECNAALMMLERSHPNAQAIRYGRNLCNRIAPMLNRLIASVESWKD